MKTQKRLAASILGVSKSKVKINPENLADVDQAITKSDIRGLIQKGHITVKKWSGQSRSNARFLDKQKREGKRSGRGSKKGSRGSRQVSKEVWMVKIRSLRRELKRLRDEDLIEKGSYRTLYGLIKGNAIRNKAHLQLYLKEKGMLKEVDKGGEKA